MPETVFAARALTKTYTSGEVEVHALRGLDPVCVGRPACRLICEGEGEGEYGAPVGIIVDTDISPMQPHDLLYDGEAEARAKRGSPSAAPESIEDPLAVLRGNAGSLVRYAYASVLAHTHNHFCPWRGMEDCVLDEVPKCIFDRMYVPLHLNRLIGAVVGDGPLLGERPGSHRRDSA